tara:strand:- start:626 stop:1156 length:531 start_codon:yes stop_codon:yes gene_type:complete
MKLGSFKNFLFYFILFFGNTLTLSAADKIQTVPLINLEELSPTFEEDKDILESIDDQNTDSNNLQTIDSESKDKKNDKIYINIKALDKITAKTSEIKLGIGEKKFFGQIEIKALKCELSENNDFTDTVAYLQVKDLSDKNNNQVFLFNGWTFASSPTLQSIDHPVYDLWITSCENI